VEEADGSVDLTRGEGGREGGEERRVGAARRVFIWLGGASRGRKARWGRLMKPPRAPGREMMSWVGLGKWPAACGAPAPWAVRISARRRARGGVDPWPCWIR